MPESRAARMTRTAISPRFAMSTLVIRRATGATTIRTEPSQGCGRPLCRGSTETTPTCGGSGPEVGPLDPEGSHERAQQRDAEADDRVRVAFDAFDERGTPGVDGEGAGHFERLARRDVGVDLGVGDVGGELH